MWIVDAKKQSSRPSRGDSNVGLFEARLVERLGLSTQQQSAIPAGARATISLKWDLWQSHGEEAYVRQLGVEVALHAACGC
jgi:hypothetical protein